MSSIAKDYDPNQPRDDHGRWTDTGKSVFKIKISSGETLTAAVDEGSIFGDSHVLLVRDNWKYGSDIARMEVNKKTGVVEFVSINDDYYKRKKVATSLWEIARHLGWNPKHNTRSLQSDEGHAWAEVTKANPLWDGDGVQGAGQPRNRLGRWIRLPGPSHLKSIMGKQLGDGKYGIFVDRETEPRRVYRRHSDANNAIRRAIKTDVELYKQKQAEKEKARRGVLERKRLRVVQSGRKQEREREQRVVVEEIAPRQSGLSLVPTKGRAKKKPPMQTTRVNVSENDQLPVPGRPTIAQTNDADKWARQTMKPEEAKYAGLITRLLRNKGVTQNPRMRGQLSERYGIPANRLIEIEQAVYDHMFPPKAPGKSPRVEGVGRVSPQQVRAYRSMGARKVIAMAAPDNSQKPQVMFKANRGENRGKWVKLSWNGAPEVIDESEAARHAVESKIYWTSQIKQERLIAERNAAKYRASQAGLTDEAADTKAALKEWKIQRAKKWASDNGFDENDSYWWGVFWNDPSLIKGGEEQAGEIEDWARRMHINLPEVVQRAKMNPALLEGLLSLPDDFDTRKMRGQRPSGRHARKGDEDYQPASAESRQGGEEWESRNRDREHRYAARMRRRYEKYKAKHPKSKMTYAQFKDAIEQGAVVKAKNPLWEGDKFQPPGQPRDFHGRFTDTGRTALGVLERAMRHHGSKPTRMASSGGGKWDHKNKTIGGVLSRLPRNSVDQMAGPDGRPLARKKMSPGAAIFARNNGPDKITDKRLEEIYDSMFRKDSPAKPITPQERDLLLNAAGREEYDGTSPIKTWVVRDRKFKQQKRNFVINTIRKELSNRAAKEAGGERGERGHVIRRHDIAPHKKAAENKKRVASGRNFVNARLREELMKDFGDGRTAPCIFCGRPVHVDEVSPERMKPGPLGGKYERGNMAPAHEKCNTRHGTAAQHNPTKYYDDMMKAFLKVYRGQINKGELGFVFAKNRAKLQGKRVVKK